MHSQRHWTVSSSLAHQKTRRPREDKDFRRPDLKRYHPGQRRSRSAKIPDFIKNPAKWTMYDLSDDGTEILSEEGLSDDQVNKRAAFQFLEEMKRLRADQRPAGNESCASDSKSCRSESSSSSGSASHKMIFQKPKHFTSSGDDRPRELSQPKSSGSSGDGSENARVCRWWKRLVQKKATKAKSRGEWRGGGR